MNERWEIGVGISDGQFMQVSYVNSICTTKGGQHANHVADKVVAKLAGVVKRKNKGEEVSGRSHGHTHTRAHTHTLAHTLAHTFTFTHSQVKAHFIKNHLAVYVNCLIENPAFDSQTKESLTTRPSAFGSEVAISDKFLKTVEKSGIVDKVLSWAKFKQNEQLKRKGGTKKSKLTGITKLDDANNAGTAKGKNCTWGGGRGRGLDDISLTTVSPRSSPSPSFVVPPHMRPDDDPSHHHNPSLTPLPPLRSKVP